MDSSGIPHTLGILLGMLSLFYHSQACPVECSSCGKWVRGEQITECYGNWAREFPSDIPALTKVLTLEAYAFSMLEFNFFKRHSLISLQRLYFTKCKIHTIQSDAFRGVGNLQELHFVENNISTVPTQNFRHLPRLKTLHIRSNPIREIKDHAFIGLINLLVLEIVNCQVEVVGPNAFARLDKLQKLKLSGNQIAMIEPALLTPLTSLVQLDLNENPWHCDCRMRPIREWMRTAKVTYGIAPQCWQPAKAAGKMWSEMTSDDFACMPELTLQVQDRVYNPGQNASFNCTFSGDPLPRIHWVLDGKIIGEHSSRGIVDPRYVIYENGTSEKMSILFIIDTQLSDSGVYECHAVNRGGNDSASFTLTIIQKAVTVVRMNGGEVAGVIIGIVMIIIIAILGFLIYRKRYQLLEPKKTGPENEAAEKETFLGKPNPVEKPPRVQITDNNIHKSDRNNYISQDPNYIALNDMKPIANSYGVNANETNNKRKAIDMDKEKEWLEMETSLCNGIPENLTPQDNIELSKFRELHREELKKFLEARKFGNCLRSDRQGQNIRFADEVEDGTEV